VATIDGEVFRMGTSNAVRRILSGAILACLIVPRGALGQCEPPAADCMTDPFVTTELTTDYLNEHGPLADIVDKRRHAAVLLLNGDGAPWCSGTLVDTDVVLTARHCTDVGIGTGVVFDSGLATERSYPITALLESGANGLDYKYYRIQGNPVADLGVEPTPLADYLPRGGEPSLLVANPRPSADVLSPRPSRVSYGHVTAVLDTVDTPPVTAIRASHNALVGSGGAGLLDGRGNLIGVYDYEPTSLAFPVDQRHCASGGGALSINDIAPSSPLTQSLLGVRLKVESTDVDSPETAAVAQVNVGCDDKRWCDVRRLGTIPNTAHLVTTGCAVGCPAGAPSSATVVHVSCDLGPNNEERLFSQRLTTLDIQRSHGTTPDPPIAPITCPPVGPCRATVVFEQTAAGKPHVTATCHVQP
jgi:hypothetical protein